MEGVRATKYGLRAYVKVGDGEHARQSTKRFKAGTDPNVIKAWRERRASELRAKLPKAAPRGTFAADVATYLEQVAAMPTFAERQRHLEIWVSALPNFPRAAITASTIRAVLQRWRADGLGAATCNKRRTALMHVWTTLDGKGASNPVRDVKKFPVSDPLPRGRDPHVIDAALLKSPRCKSRACARVMLWTGMRPEELLRAQSDDVDLTAGTVIVRTAKGGRARVVPLTKQGISAWREFAAAGCWDEPDNTTLTVKTRRPRRHQQKRLPDAAPLGRWLKAHTGMPDLRVYDLRHSYGTALARRQTRLDVIGGLMGHSTLELTKRYTLAALTPDAEAATKALSRKKV